MARKTSPADSKTYIRVTDKWGRRWGVVMEMSRLPGGAGNRLAPCSPWEPIGWSAPWYPPSQYMKLDPENPHLVVIEDERCVADQRQSHRDRAKMIRQLGQEKHGHAFDENAPPTKQILDLVGPEPWAWQLAEAARRGDRWVLGLTDKVNEALVKFLPQPAEDEEWDLGDDLLDLGEDLEEEAPAQRGRGGRRAATAGSET